MEHFKYNRLRTDCQTAISDNNLEKCFELLAENLDERSAAYNEYIQLRRRFSEILQLWIKGQMSQEEYSRTESKISDGVIKFIDHSIKPEDVSLLRRIHDRVLVIACKNSPTDWEKLFNEAYFSHARVIQYKDDVPEEFKNPDVIVFDDLGCPTKNHIYMDTYIKEIPEAHIL